MEKPRIINYIDIDGEDVLMESLPDEKRRKIAETLASPEYRFLPRIFILFGGCGIFISLFISYLLQPNHGNPRVSVLYSSYQHCHAEI